MPVPLDWFRRWRIITACLALAFAAAPAAAQVRTAPTPVSGAGRASVASPANGSARPSSDPRLAAFDPPTRMLIEMELRDAPPAERDEWLSLLATVDRDQVPHLLEARRRASTGRLKSGGTPLQSPNRSRATSSPPAAVSGADRGRSASNQPTPAPVSATSGPTQNVSSTMPGYGAAPPTASSAPSTPAPAPSVTAMPAPSVESAALNPAATNGSPPAAHGGFLSSFRREHESDRSVSQTAYLPTGSAGTPQDETSATTAPPGAGDEPAGGRRWMAPLRPLRGDSPRGAAPASEARTTPAPAANSNSEPRSSAYMNVELQRVMTLLRAEMEYGPSSGTTAADREQVRRHIQKRLLHLLAEEPEQAIQAIPGLPAAEQEFWTQLLWSLANELHPPADMKAEQRIVRTAKLVAEAERHLRELCPLEIHLACFCHKINSFGSYERFTRDEFRPGQPVLIYAELRNFTSELTVDAQYRTRLRTTMEIRVADAPQDAPAVDRQDFPATEDYCRSPRHDYFHSYRIDIPQQLPAGRYLLRLALVDEISGKSATTDLPFTVW